MIGDSISWVAITIVILRFGWPAKIRIQRGLRSYAARTLDCIRRCAFPQLLIPHVRSITLVAGPRQRLTPAPQGPRQRLTPRPPRAKAKEAPYKDTPEEPVTSQSRLPTCPFGLKLCTRTQQHSAERFDFILARGLTYMM